MKKFLFAGMVLLVAACNMNSPEALNKQIIANKKKVLKLNEKISVLEEKLDSISGPEPKEQGTVIIVKKMIPEEFSHFIFVTGKVEAIDDIWVSPEINGQVKKVHIKEGQRVEKGQLLVTLNSDVTEKSILEVKTNLELLKKLYEKQKELWDQKIGSEVQYLQAKSAFESAEARLATLQEQLEMSKVKAPFPGIVDKISVELGELAMPGARLLQLVNPKKLKIVAQISENYLNTIKKGERAQIEFPATPGVTADLQITRVGTVIENQSRTFSIEIEMDNKDELIKPNQLATMKLTDYETDHAFIVPSIILKQDIQGYYLYKTTKTDKGLTADKIYVTPGKSAKDLTMIEKGIEEGMEIIVKGFNLVKDGTLVKVVSE